MASFLFKNERSCNSCKKGRTTLFVKGYDSLLRDNVSTPCQLHLLFLFRTDTSLIFFTNILLVFLSTTSIFFSHPPTLKFHKKRIFAYSIDISSYFHSFSHCLPILSLFTSQHTSIFLHPASRTFSLSLSLSLSLSVCISLSLSESLSLSISLTLSLYLSLTLSL